MAVIRIVLVALLCSAAASAEVDAKTQKLWKAKCASCHGASGKADTETGAKLKIPDMTAVAWQKERTDDRLRKSINEGVKKGNDGMDPYKDVLTPEQIDALIGQVRAFGKS
jgi:mono/diheme cytochrome c family protein